MLVFIYVWSWVGTIFKTKHIGQLLAFFVLIPPLSLSLLPSLSLRTLLFLFLYAQQYHYAINKLTLHKELFVNDPVIYL